MQKTNVGFEKAKENEKELKRENASLMKRVEKADKENAYHAQLWREACLENDKLK